jgi:hypothetical protein
MMSIPVSTTRTTDKPMPRVGTTVFSRDGARVGTIARVFSAEGTGPATPVRYAFLLEPAPAADESASNGPVCLPASAIIRAGHGRVTLKLTRDQLAA